MKTLFLFRVGALAVAAILHNELIVSSHSVFDGLNYNGLLCNIAWEWFWLSSVGKQLFTFFIKRKKTIIKANKKSKVLLLRWEKPKPQERWQSVGWVGAKRSAIAFLFFLFTFF
jgi:hypothetical protein